MGEDDNVPRMWKKTFLPGLYPRAMLCLLWSLREPFSAPCGQINQEHIQFGEASFNVLKQDSEVTQVVNFFHNFSHLLFGGSLRNTCVLKIMHVLDHAVTAWALNITTNCPQQHLSHRHRRAHGARLTGPDGQCSTTLLDSYSPSAPYPAVLNTFIPTSVASSFHISQADNSKSFKSTAFNMFSYKKKS